MYFNLLNLAPLPLKKRQFPSFFTTCKHECDTLTTSRVILTVSFIPMNSFNHQVLAGSVEKAKAGKYRLTKASGQAGTVKCLEKGQVPFEQELLVFLWPFKFPSSFWTENSRRKAFDLFGELPMIPPPGSLGRPEKEHVEELSHVQGRGKVRISTSRL